MLTHVNYAFGLIDPDNLAILGDPEADVEHAYPGDSQEPGALRGNFRQLQLLKERHPHLKTLISMGGWTGSGRFSDAVATEEKRRAFVASCIELFLTRWPGVFDGIDIDWEYPVCCGLPENAYRPEDKRNCTLLFAELRRQLDELEATTGQRYLLTTAIPAGRKLPVTCFELREIAEILDWINVMTYDLTGSSGAASPTSTPPSAAPAATQLAGTAQYHNVVATVDVFLEEGRAARPARRRRPFYGRGFTGVPASTTASISPSPAPRRGLPHDQGGAPPDIQRFWHPEAQVPWLFDPATGAMLSYDDPESLADKAAYVRDQGLGGIMIWELSDDDDQSSLLTAIGSGLGT